ncbi:MAG TPA: hypothetical protein PKM63_07080 [Panacibacter sp.]|nr:hypothetical protein [Panacibacter sp.]HNP44032.1 hypothetical protein [Panacibacter sp.]
MKTASISELKQELQYRSDKEIMELCLQLARFKKENKELLTYLLFEAQDEEAYTAGVKQMLEEAFKEIHTTNLYFAKKNLRRILRQLSKNIKYSGNKQTEAALLIYYCKLLKASGINLQKSTMINNLFQQQLKKIKAAIAGLHEDLQYDLLNDLKNVQVSDTTKAS